MSLVEKIAQRLPEYTAWRRDFHAHPEVGFEEHRTAGLVAERLQAMGIEVHTGIGGTGVVGVIRGKATGNTPRTVGLRADMDALPLTEANAFAHASTHQGRMHGCGHDGHTTMLLAAARELAETRDFEGTVHLYFQPAEELGAGAPAMQKDGLFQRFPADAVYALHNRPGMPVGHYGLRSGPMLAGVTFWDIHVQGKGGHAARPEVTHDPVVCGAALISALQSVVSRNVSPHAQAVLSVTGMETGRAYNVIPDGVRLFGTVRTYAVEVTDLIRERMGALASSVAAGFGCTAQLDFRVLTPPLINSAENAERFGDAVAGLVGEDKVKRAMPPSMGGEDFAYFLQEVPGAFLNVGNGTEGADLHHPRYDFNDEAIPYGAAALVAVVRKELGA
ncbi:amidohydrolase [Rhodovarius crocodyli]|uniref:Amidohydrolase n=1 Tax=Rhodovarius crocodyli TaxID=1979269 RepID=A0A437MJA8_9PROT|nr:M20 aminoacylase family protein [Rhodovarius crocodyli]RVT97709.1 amidohydrolase [Rhodovarius crocodyli]